MRCKYLMGVMAVIFVSACVEQFPGLQSFTSLYQPQVSETPTDLIATQNLLLIPPSPISAENQFTMSFELKNLDPSQEVKNVDVCVYDTGMCTASSDVRLCSGAVATGGTTTAGTGGTTSSYTCTQTSGQTCESGTSCPSDKESATGTCESGKPCCKPKTSTGGCTANTWRCDGAKRQSCRLDASGIWNWDTVIDCATSGQTCKGTGTTNLDIKCE